MSDGHRSLIPISSVLESIAEWTGRGVAWLTLLMVVVTFAVVVLRYAFNLGWIAMQESITYLHAVVFMLGAAYTQKHNGHVRVDIFYQKFSPRTRAWVDLLGALLLLLPVCVFILWISWDYVVVSWSLREESREAGGLPWVYWLKTAIPIMALLLILQGLAQSIRNIDIIMNGPRNLDGNGMEKI